ncbi:MAG: Hsp20 family protein [Deltaproteobacteria bacterium]|nr:Hsp20 family protein [Deltaproteobacteria bacterium]
MKVDAKYKDGILTVVLPQEDDPKARKIEVH